jgi:hypothetical protein
MYNENEKIDMELDLDSLDGVVGGAAVNVVAPKIPSDDTVIAYCKKCGKILDYLGQDRVQGGNTGKFKCMNRKCIYFDQLKYNDEVDW